jgi:hypothetical protein
MLLDFSVSRTINQNKFLSLWIIQPQVFYSNENEPQQ